MRTKNKNTSFATDLETFALGKVLASLEGVSLSSLVDQALREKMRRLLPRHEHNPSVQELAVSARLIPRTAQQPEPVATASRRATDAVPQPTTAA